MDAKGTIKSALIKNIHLFDSFRSTATYCEKTGEEYDPSTGTLSSESEIEKDFIGIFVSAIDQTIPDIPFLQDDLKSIVVMDEIDFKIKASGIVTYNDQTYRLYNVKEVFGIAYIFYMRPI